MMSQFPLGFGQWLQVLSYAQSKPREVAIIGDAKAAGTQALLGVVRGGYRPFQVVALGSPGAQPPAVPLLQGRGLIDGCAAAYVCDAPVPGRAFACQAPVTEPKKLQAHLGMHDDAATARHHQGEEAGPKTQVRPLWFDSPIPLSLARLATSLTGCVEHQTSHAGSIPELIPVRQRLREMTPR